MIVLFPGTVTVYIPYRIIDQTGISNPTAWSLTQYAATLLVSFGIVILLKCIWDFAHVGRGTLAPFNETKRLIIIGLYRYVRNPMYVGVMFILLGESWFFLSIRLLVYTGICFIVANFFVIGYEENRLRFKYGKEYRRYCHLVRRWIPGRPFSGDGG